MKPNFNQLLKKYEDRDFLLHQKAKVLLTICLTLLALLPVVLFYTIVLVKTTAPGVLLPEIGAFFGILCALFLLLKGRFSVASHLILITCLAAAWTVLFLDRSGPISQLDTIAYVLAILTMTPLIVKKRKWPIIAYFLANVVLLTVYVMFVGKQFIDKDIVIIEYWMDNLVAILFICIISYKVFSVNRKALDKAKKEIIERKNAEEATATAKTFLLRSLESIPDGVLLLDENIRFSYVNPVFLNWVGCSEKEILGKRIDDIAVMFLDAKSRKMLKEKLIDQVKGGATISGAEIKLIDSKGKYKPVSISTSGIKDENGKIIGGVAILVDLTERRQLEIQLRQSHKMEAIGTLAGGIAHDFNNILSAIMGNTELLLYKNDLKAPEQKKLNNIYTASQRAKDLVGQILMFSRKKEQEIRPVALRIIIKETIKLLKASLPSTIEIRQHMSDESVQVMADPTQIHQILMNLCTNAHHAMINKGGVLEIRLSKIDVVPGEIPENPGLKPGGWVKLSVSDTGDGMPPEMQDRIFEPYFSTKEKEVGTGLGLAVVHGIVQSYGGLIEVHSNMGQGSKFTIFLPGVNKIIEETVSTLEPLSLGNNERILFVDDESMLIDFGKTALEQLKYKVVTASRPDEALKIFTANPDHFDLVITDLTMPKMTGDVLAEKMLQIRPDIPIILCTGFSETITKGKASAKGIRDFLFKPINIHKLAESIHHILNNQSQS